MSERSQKCWLEVTVKSEKGKMSPFLKCGQYTGKTPENC